MSLLKAFAVMACVIGVSWLGTCAIIKILTLCFGLTFKWSFATGIWLIICILKNCFEKKNDK